MGRGLTKAELQHQKDLQYIKNFRLIDDDFLKKVFKDKACTQLLLRIIMDKPDLIVKDVQTEYVVHNLYGRSVRLDVFAVDSKGKEYNIEIQRSDKGAGVKRARYNSSMLDVDIMKPGDDLDKLPETYVIFITEHDILGGNQPIYHIDRVIRETGEIFDDKAHIIYVNNEIKNDDTPLGLLMKDFVCTKAEDMYYNELAERVRYFKETERGMSSMCRAMEEMRAEAKAEALAEAAAKREAEIAEAAAKREAEIAEALRNAGVSEETIQEAIKNRYTLQEK